MYRHPGMVRAMRGVALVVVTVQLYSTILGMDGVPLGDVEVGERMLEITQTHFHMKDTYRNK